MVIGQHDSTLSRLISLIFTADNSDSTHLSQSRVKFGSRLMSRAQPCSKVILFEWVIICSIGYFDAAVTTYGTLFSHIDILFSIFCVRYFTSSIFCHFDILFSIFCHLDILFSIFYHFDILFSTFCFRYFATSIFCLSMFCPSIFCFGYFVRRYFAFSLLYNTIFCFFDILRVRYFAIRYFATSIFCDFDILSFDNLRSIFCVSIFCHGSNIYPPPLGGARVKGNNPPSSFFRIHC